MRMSLRWLCGVVLLAPLAIAESDPCAPEDGSVDVNFPNPDLAGYGVGAKISSAEAFEADPGSDDSLGPANHGGGSVTVTVSNDGDNLSAGGETGDGSSGDDCFEIYVTWTIIYYTSVQSTETIELGPFSFSTTVSRIVESKAEVSSPTVTVCPC